MAKENQNNNAAKPQTDITQKGYQPLKEGHQPDIPTNAGYQPGKPKQPEGGNPPTIEDTIDSGRKDDK